MRMYLLFKWPQGEQPKGGFDDFAGMGFLMQSMFDGVNFDASKPGVQYNYHIAQVRTQKRGDTEDYHFCVVARHENGEWTYVSENIVKDAANDL